MAITADIRARCRLCTDQAAGILTGMIRGKRTEPIAVQARRTAADIAADTVYTLLQRTFITPIDREDLWLMHESAERIWREAEETALLLYHSMGQLPHACEVAIRAAATCCTSVSEVIETFPDLNTTSQQMHVLREAERICHMTLRNSFADTAVERVCRSIQRVLRACEELIRILRYIAVKNE